jgi:diguanylate cyclase (GGDEF)-like protein
MSAVEQDVMMNNEPAETISLRQLRAARSGDTDVVPVPRTRIAPAARTANLVQIGPTGPGLGRRFPIGASTVTLGRDSQCSLPISDGSVSRMHTIIEPRADGSYTLSDLNSRNGTYVNGARVSAVVLKDGDYLQLGNCVYRFLAGGNVEASYHDEIHRLTMLDSLTGVHNRRSLGEFLDREVDRAVRHSRPIAVVLIDVDFFKQVNDRHGHPGGDAVLREVADRLRRKARAEDLVSRYGGEEFAVAMPETTLAAAIAVAERFRGAIAESPFRFGTASFCLTVSIGAAAIEPGETKTADKLLNIADARMYEAKRAGRNRVIPAPSADGQELTSLDNTPAPIGATLEIQL